MPEDAAQRLSHLESMLDDLTGLGELRGQIDEHSERLAEMFTRKASKVTRTPLLDTRHVNLSFTRQRHCSRLMACG